MINGCVHWWTIDMTQINCQLVHFSDLFHGSLCGPLGAQHVSVQVCLPQMYKYKYNCGGPACFGGCKSTSSAPTATILSSVAKAIHHRQSKYVHCQYCVIAVVLQCLLWLALVSSVLEHFCLLSFPLSTFRGNYQHLDNQIRQCVWVVTVHEGRKHTWGESKMCPRLQE